MRALVLPFAVAALLLGLPLGPGDPGGDERPKSTMPDATPDSPGAATEAPGAGSDAPAQVDRPVESSTVADLRGPRAAVAPNPAPKKPTIIERGFDGRLVLVTGEPEASALRALDLTPAERDAVDAVVSRRIAAFDAQVQSHVLELLSGFGALGRVEGAKSGTERWAALAEFMAAWDAFRPWRERGTVIDEIGDAIPESKRRAARHMVVAYRAAVAREKARDKGVAPSNGELQFELHLEEFGALLTESFARQEKSGNEDLDRMARELRLTPEQTERARVIFTDLALKEYRREAGDWDRLRAFGDFMKDLTSEQRRRAWRFVRANSP